MVDNERRRLLTPSKITAWLDCAHYLTLKHAPSDGGRGGARFTVGSFAQLLMEKGLAHEAAVEASYVDAGSAVYRVDGRRPGETFAAWADRVAAALETDVDVLIQMPLVYDGIRGVADFVERVVDGDGSVRWEPVDAKLARREAKPGHVLQLCFYAEALGDATGVVPEELKVSLGSGTDDSVGYESVRPYWARLRTQLAAVMDAGPEAETRPEPCDHCEFCEFAPACEVVWRDEDSLIYVAWIGKTDRSALEAAGVTAMADLAVRIEPVTGIRAERLDRLRVQAELQVAARQTPDELPPLRLIEPGEDSVWGRGFERMPAPDDGDIFLDFEGHPFWRADRGLFFLFGYVARGADGNWEFRESWAHNEAEERDCVRELVNDIRDRRAANPGMHVYHYNHTERSALESMAAEHGVVERILAELIDAEVFVDLFAIVRNAMQVGVESYSLKHLEVLTGYERSHEIDKGAGAVVAYEDYLNDRDDAHLRSIAAYNEDDVRATRALRDWLVGLRPGDLHWRPDPVHEPSEDADEIDTLIEALAASGEGTLEHLLSGLLGYWRRERRAHMAPILSRLDDDEPELLDDPGVLAGLHGATEFERFGKTGKLLSTPGMRFRFPPQELEPAYASRPPDKMVFTTVEGVLGYLSVSSIDVDNGVLELVWGAANQELGEMPTAAAPDDWVSQKSKFAVLLDLARKVHDPATHGAPSPLALRLLRRDPPAFSGAGPEDGVFSDDVGELADLVVNLDGSVLGVQGPPGTGKTYRGAHIAKALVAGGKRVGIMAMSHHAIDNFLEEVVEVFSTEPSVDLRALRRVSKKPAVELAGVTYVTKNDKLGNDDFDIVAGTSWMFAAKSMSEAPVDVVLIDEAGQLALIDAVVASVVAKNMVLLGDPLQLPQVAQAIHPGDSGASALGYILGSETTIPADRGVFIEETRRMHPDVCRFISERIYDGRLRSHTDCAAQTTDEGTGLRWLRAEHEGCSTESTEEAELVAKQIRWLLGRSWTNKESVDQPITTADIMVVAPYNDQVRLLRDRLDADPATARIEVGTVDKFQGRQAPIVFFTMTSSSADDMPRGADFLFSRNRLNVAISRAQCLAYLVCTEPLLDSRAKTVDDMLLISTLCALVENALESAPS